MTRSPECFRVSKSLRNDTTSPPGLPRIRTSANAGASPTRRKTAVIVARLTVVSRSDNVERAAAVPCKSTGPRGGLTARISHSGGNGAWDFKVLTGALPLDGGLRRLPLTRAGSGALGQLAPPSSRHKFSVKKSFRAAGLPANVNWWRALQGGRICGYQRPFSAPSSWRLPPHLLCQPCGLPVTPEAKSGGTWPSSMRCEIPARASSSTARACQPAPWCSA